MLLAFTPEELELPRVRREHRMEDGENHLTFHPVEGGKTSKFAPHGQRAFFNECPQPELTFIGKKELQDNRMINRDLI